MSYAILKTKEVINIMAWFFTEENISGSNYTLVGESAKHISKVLRMRTGEDITLVSPDKTQYECKNFAHHAG